MVGLKISEAYCLSDKWKQLLFQQVSQETTTSVNLSWDRPYSDGGSKIQGYKIEYREVVEEHWVVSTTSLVRSQTYTVTGLVTGSEYEFRIKAVNAAGESRPSPPSAQVKQ